MVEGLFILQLVILAAFLVTHVIMIVGNMVPDFKNILAVFLDRPKLYRKHSFSMSTIGGIAIVSWWILLPLTWFVYTKIIYKDEQ